MDKYVPADKLLSRMTRYGIVCGVLTAILLLFLIDFVDGVPWQIALTTGCTLGSFIGGVFGMFAGFLNGVILTNLLPRWITPFNVQIVRLRLSIITIIVTGLVLAPCFKLADDIFPFQTQRNNFLAGLIFSIGLSVYACQRVITKYLRETDLRKAKGKSHA